MKRYIFLLFLCILSCTIAAQEAKNQTDSRGLKQGVWEKQKEGKLIYQGSFIDNKPVGIFKRYKDGILSSEQNFIQDSPISTIKLYDKKGTLISTGQYNLHLKDGLWEYYTPEGIVIKRENYSEGKFQGEVLMYDTKGILMDVSHWKHGILDGKREIYYTQDQVEVTCFYKLGNLDGNYISYYDNGKPQSEGKYDQGEKDGNWNYYYKADGKVSSTVHYKKGVLQGKAAKNMQVELENYEKKLLTDPANFTNDPDAYMNL